MRHMHKLLPIAALVAFGIAPEARAQSFDLGASLNLLKGFQASGQSRTEFHAGSVDNRVQVGQARALASGDGSVVDQNFGISASGGSLTRVQGSIRNDVRVQDAYAEARGRNAVVHQNFGVQVR